jgi:hypothetical protein
VALVLVFLAPYCVGLLPAAQASSPEVAPAASGSIAGVVTWNGVNVNTAPNPSSAISWTFDNVATVNFTWAGAQLPGVNQAFLVILFLGFPAYTKQVVQSAPLPVGSIPMTYGLTQFKWYVQGLYELHAYLENPGGNVLWSTHFYVRVAQPYDLVAATVGLVLLLIAELYMIATVGPRALDKMRKQPPAPKTTPAPASSTTESATATTEEKT